MSKKNRPVGAGLDGMGDNHGSDYQQHSTTHPTEKQLPFKTDLPGLLAQANERQRRAELAGDIAGAVAHMSVWFELHRLVTGYGGAK